MTVTIFGGFVTMILQCDFVKPFYDLSAMCKAMIPYDFDGSRA
jgi:hypothetical protein